MALLHSDDDLLLLVDDDTPLGDGFVEDVEDVIKQRVPPASASTEDKRAAQKARAGEFGVEALEGKGERLSYPAGFPTELKDYGDPVNLMFPISPPSRANNARSRFKQFAKRIYSKAKSVTVVHERIVRRQLANGTKPSFNEDDPLDRALPASLKDKLRKAVELEDEEFEEKLFLRLFKKAVSDDKQIVYGVVLEPGSVDAHGDTIKASEILRAAHLWLARHQNRGEMHRKIVNSKVEIYESYIAATNMQIGGQKVKKGSWVMAVHVLDDALWQKIKKGEYTGFSMGGFARRRRLS